MFCPPLHLRLSRKCNMIGGMGMEWKFSSEAILMREHGLPVTRRRVNILRFFENADAPLSADSVRKEIRGTDRATIYRALSRFADAGLLHRVNVGGPERLFEFAGEHHHHLVCTSCEKIEDLAVAEKNIDREALQSSKNFAAVKSHSLEFFGLCKACAR